MSVLEGGYKVQGGPVSALGRSVASHVRALSGSFNDTWDTAREQEALRTELSWLAAQEASAKAEAAAKAEAIAAAKAESAAAAAAAGGDAVGKSGGPSGEATMVGSVGAGAMVGEEAKGVAAEEAGSRAKRRRDPVDYAALDAKMKEEALARNQLPK